LKDFDLTQAIIAGSTGLVGSELLKLILDRSDYEETHLLLRRPLVSKRAKLREYIINFEQVESLTIPAKNADFYCALGTTIKKAGNKENFRKVDHDYIVNFGKLAKKLNAQKFLVVSAVAADSKSSIFYSRVKGETEDALKSLDLNALYIFRPSLIHGDRQETRTAEKLGFYALNLLSPLLLGPLKKYRAVSAKQMAMAMLDNALTKDEKFKIIESDEIIEY
jgi:uncharacterized protein YbjT (DUF2867 family)